MATESVAARRACNAKDAGAPILVCRPGSDGPSWRMFRLPCVLAVALAALSPAGGAETAVDPFAWVDATPVTTSVYLGTVTLTATRFLRQAAGYVAGYSARVFPYFFLNESGTLRIEISAPDLQRLAAGATVAFHGRAVRTDGRVRAIDGRVTPLTAATGQLKVRLHVNRSLTLVFDSTYRLAQ